MSKGRPEAFLWKKRYRYQWAQRRKMLGLVIDWVIALYFIVPALIIGTVIYIQGIAAHPIWWTSSVATLVYVFLMMYPLFASVYPLFSLGDEGILIASPLSPRRFLLYRWIEDMATKFVAMLLIWGLLSPYLHLLGYKYVQITMLALLWYIMGVFIVQNNWLWVGRSRWFHRIGKFVHRGMLLALWLLGIHFVQTELYYGAVIQMLLLLIVWLWLLRRNYFYRWQWSELIQQSVSAQMGMFELILGGESMKKRLKAQKKRPARLLRGNLGMAFRPKNALFFLYVKSFLRTRDLIVVYVQALAYILLAVYFVSKWWISAIVLIVGVFMLGSVLLSNIRSNANPWLDVYPFSYNQWKKGLIKGAGVLNGIVAILGSIIVTIHLGTWYFFIPIAVITIVVAWSSCELAIMERKSRKSYHA